MTTEVGESGSNLTKIAECPLNRTCLPYWDPFTIPESVGCYQTRSTVTATTMGDLVAVIESR